MMYPYLTFEDGTEVVHSQLLPDECGDRILVHFERPADEGFDSVRFELPSYEMTAWEGHYSETELQQFKTFLENNAHLLYRYAVQGGIKIA